MSFIKDQKDMKNERVLFWLVHNSFQVHRFINHFFGFSVIVQKDRMIQVALCEPRLTGLNKNT